MGKVATAAAAGAGEMTRKKKKGRPSKNPISTSTLNKPISLGPNPIIYRRSDRRNQKSRNSAPPEIEDGDDDDERKEKKVKLVGRLPESEERHSQDGSDSASESGSDSASESEDRQTQAKKRRINAGDRGSDDGVSLQEQKGVKATDTPVHGLPLKSGPTTPLPDKKLLVFILDRLQKKDAYGVFSEPVDINDLPDYFDIVKKPMDFGTVRKKLNGKAYKCLEDLEADVFLLCSNAMLYNAQDTIYHRQARAILDLAKRDFENLRHEGDNGEPQPKVVRRGRPPSNKNLKKSLETSPIDLAVRAGPEPSSAPTLTNGEDKTTAGYNLRKAPALNRFRSNDPYVSSYRPRNGEYSEWLADWNDEFPASILRADMKNGKKHITVDETRRDTYKQFHSANNSPFSTNSIGDAKLLIPVGLQEPLSYARSLARYAANLGPIAWKVAARKIEYVLPPSVQYGPGWVGDNGEPSSNSSAADCNSNKHATPSTSGLSCGAVFGPSEAMVEAVRKLNSQNEVGIQGEASSWKTTPFPQVQQRLMYHHQPQRNGLPGMFRYDTSKNEPSYPSPLMNHEEAKMWSFGNAGWLGMPAQQNRGLQGTPDLNVRIPAGSPSSSNLQIGSPQQPDLVLQL